jgi:hypothetical protein
MVVITYCFGQLKCWNNKQKYKRWFVMRTITTVLLSITKVLGRTEDICTSPDITKAYFIFIIITEEIMGLSNGEDPLAEYIDHLTMKIYFTPIVDQSWWNMVGVQLYIIITSNPLFIYYHQTLTQKAA